MSLTIEMVESRIKEIEQAIAQSLANHNALLGGLSATQDILRAMKEGCEALIPDSSVTKAVEVVSECVDVAQHALQD